MFIMNSKWLTFWVLEYTIIWIILDYFVSKKFIKIINPSYLLLLIAYGYLGIVFYQLIVVKLNYEFLFLLFNILFHFIPLFLFQKYYKVKGNLLFSLLFIMIYLGYISKLKMNLYNIYTKFQIKSFKDLKEYIN